MRGLRARVGVDSIPLHLAVTPAQTGMTDDRHGMSGLECGLRQLF